jgi:hypothetical protein
MLALMTLLAASVNAAVDTLQDNTEVRDGTIYGYSNCNPEVFGEECRRYNSGGVLFLNSGITRADNTRRILISLPGYAGNTPDSAELLLYCHSETDTGDRRLFAYPLTRGFLEGSESAFGVGNYPDPDSGATWLHAWLDDGDNDSLCWTSPGGDYTTAVACTVTVTGTDRHFSFRRFERILTYWDTSGHDHGCIIVNENADPSSSSNKTFCSSEHSTYPPVILLYYSDETPPRRRRAASLLIPGADH